MATRKTSMQVWLWSSAALSGGVGWYLYQAGGKKSAEKEAQQNSMTSAKSIGADAGQKIDSAINEARTTANRVDQKLEAYRAQADKKVGDYSTQVKKDAQSAVEQFDKTVEDQAAKSKGWLSGWFK
ncbi:hypothetical protein IWX90DRAFT_425685 [Phyllosticta citrichinensis]|uniref:Uncharacterized protein n=1 Tax=Phyllosticta citrichinensis TaxID=1130410 RepID=A0ABR1Y4S1_9PEZI